MSIKLSVGGLVRSFTAKITQVTVNKLNQVSNAEISRLSGITSSIQEQLTQLSEKLKSANTEKNSFKSTIATAINNKRGESIVTGDSTEQQFQDAVDGIDTGIDTSDGNIAPADVLKGRIGYADGVKVVGTMANNGAVNYTDLIAGKTCTIPAGYHNGSGTVSTASLKDQTLGTATRENILEGKIAWVDGTRIVGSILTVDVSMMVTPTTTNNSLTYYIDKYVVKPPIVMGDPNLVSGNILYGRSIFNVGGSAGQLHYQMVDSSTLTYVVKIKTENIKSNYHWDVLVDSTFRQLSYSSAAFTLYNIGIGSITNNAICTTNGDQSPISHSGYNVNVDIIPHIAINNNRSDVILECAIVGVDGTLTSGMSLSYSIGLQYIYILASGSSNYQTKFTKNMNLIIELI